MKTNRYLSVLFSFLFLASFIPMTSCGDDDNSKSDNPTAETINKSDYVESSKEYLSRFKNLIYVQFNDNVSASQKEKTLSSLGVTNTKAVYENVYFIDSDMLAGLAQLSQTTEGVKYMSYVYEVNGSIEIPMGILVALPKDQQISDVLSKLGIAYTSAENKGDYYLVTLSSGFDAIKITNQIHTSGTVTYAEPNFTTYTLNLM
jgi:hypothetical protein